MKRILRSTLLVASAIALGGSLLVPAYSQQFFGKQVQQSLSENKDHHDDSQVLSEVRELLSDKSIPEETRIRDALAMIDRHTLSRGSEDQLVAKPNNPPTGSIMAVPKGLQPGAPSMIGRPHSGNSMMDPFAEMKRMREMMDRMMGQSIHSMSPQRSFAMNAPSTPDVRMSDQGAHYEVTISADGTSKDDIQVQVNDRSLSISGSVVSVTEETDANGRVIRSSRSKSSFHRTLPLPADVDGDKVKIDEQEEGIIIILPKA